MGHYLKILGAPGPKGVGKSGKKKIDQKEVATLIWNKWWV